MKPLFFLIVGLYMSSSSNTERYSDEKTFVIEKKMVLFFDKEKGQIHLTQCATSEVSKVDFSKVVFLKFDSCEEKIPIISNTMAILPPAIFIYRRQKSIFYSEGVIQLEIRHLKQQSKELPCIELALKRDK